MELSENYRILYDSHNVILRFHEIRTKTKKTGEKEQYEAIEDTFYPTVQAALKSYVQKELKHSESISECLDRIGSLEKKIEGMALNRLTTLTEG